MDHTYLISNHIMAMSKEDSTKAKPDREPKDGLLARLQSRINGLRSSSSSSPHKRNTNKGSSNDIAAMFSPHSPFKPRHTTTTTTTTAAAAATKNDVSAVFPPRSPFKPRHSRDSFLRTTTNRAMRKANGKAL